MAEVTVKQLAEVVGTPIDRLLEQLSEAGVGKSSADDSVTDDEKMQLLDYLRTSHGRSVGTGSGGDDEGGGGGDALFDAFTALPGLRMDRLLSVLDHPASHDTVIWSRTAPLPPSDRLH